MRNWHRHKNFSKFHYAVPLLILIWGSCYSPNKAVKQVDKAIKKFPAQIVEQLRDSFPCVSLKIDTIYDWHDTTIFVDCPPPKEQEALVIYDTIIVGGNKKPEKASKRISIPTITITKEVEDSASLNGLKLAIQKLEQEKSEYLKQLNDCKGVKQGRGVSMWWLIPVLISILAAFFSLLKFKNERKA